MMKEVWEMKESGKGKVDSIVKIWIDVANNIMVVTLLNYSPSTISQPLLLPLPSKSSFHHICILR